MEYWDIVLLNFMGLIRMFFTIGTILSAVICANWLFELEFDKNKKDRKRILNKIVIWGSLVVILPFLMCFVPI